MRSLIEIGSARAQPGQLAYGALEAVELPSGGVDSFPIIIAQGQEDGPVLWLTASIHGAEYTGIPVIHQLLMSDLVSRMRGTVIAVPTLNPAGLRTARRVGYYMGGLDPNRLFPAPPSTRRGGLSPDAPPSIIEAAYGILFDYIRTTANYLVDLHNYSIGALSFAFRDPVYYRNGRDKGTAQHLYATTNAMLTAFGHTIINEFASPEYLKLNLHRSVSGSALNAAHIPAFTAELGGYMTVDPDMVKAAVSGLRNVMRWAGLLGGTPEPITGIKILSPGYPLRRTQHPFAPRSGIVTYFVKAGDPITIGDPVARICDIYGRPLGGGEGLVRSEYDGIVLGVPLGAVCYKNEPLLNLAIRDEGSLILPYPA